MLQVALGGYLGHGSTLPIYDDAPVYYEPGYNIMSILEIDVPRSNEIYLLVKKRIDDDGQVFSGISVDDLQVSVKDATINEDIPYTVVPSIRPEWDLDTSASVPLIISVTNYVDDVRVRVLDIIITDTIDNEFINFRVTVEDVLDVFHYIAIDVADAGSRNKFSTASVETTISINKKGDSYMLFSPDAFLQEVDTEEGSSFSYPLNSFYYKRQSSYNDEDFEFSIDAVSHSFVSDNIQLIDIPRYNKAAVLLIDRHLYTDMLQIFTRSSVSIRSTGVLSGISYVFQIFFVR